MKMQKNRIVLILLASLLIFSMLAPYHYIDEILEQYEAIEQALALIMGVLL